MNSVFVSEVTVFSARLVEQRIVFGSFLTARGSLRLGRSGKRSSACVEQKLLPNSGAGFGAPEHWTNTKTNSDYCVG